MKQPFFIYRKDGNPLLLAAIGTTFENGNDQEGFLIVTAAADEELLDIHDRRPLVYSPMPHVNGQRNTTGKEAEDIAREGSLPPKISHGTPVSRAVAIREPGPGTYRATDLADGEIPGIDSQGYAPFLWITHCLFYLPEHNLQEQEKFSLQDGKYLK
ncbi:SOS response-associated peptidase family protein [Klebsiella pneumoniae]|uniref:SOS response-associated peptidase family protein n=1 Tax=Klebsiella pneumoniae TaxID=573 RepID=UPI003A5CE968